MNNKPTSESSLILTETEQEFCKGFIGDFFSRYLEQINDDIRCANQILNHSDSWISAETIIKNKTRLRQSHAERTKTVLAIEFLKSKGAL